MAVVSSHETLINVYSDQYAMHAKYVCIVYRMASYPGSLLVIYTSTHKVNVLIMSHFKAY